MKIGIITWFDGANYGTNLQAIALQKYLRNTGYEVKIIDFIPPKVKDVSKRTFWEKVAYQPQKYANLYSEHKYKKQIEDKTQKLKRTIKNNCIFTDLVTDESSYIDTCNQFDILIFGSDQIWNPNWYHRFYYGDYPEIKVKKIAYAPSLGVSEIEKGKVEKIRRSLKGFSTVSVREEQGANMIEFITGVRPQQVVDPTFLLGVDEWSKFIPNENSEHNEYVISMFLTDNRHHWKAATRFAKKYHLKHIIIPYTGFSYMQHADIRADVGIEELLSLIKNAKYVLTDSFHISVFSIIFNREFYTFMRFKEDGFISQNSRVTNLLHMVDLENRLISYGTNRIERMKCIEYESINIKLQKEIENSKAFLANALEL